VSLGTTGTIQVLANDTDGNGDDLSVTGMTATSSQGGTIVRASPSGNSVNILHYTPTSGFRGTDSFEYSIEDSNGGIDSATVTITVPNVAPSAVNDSATVELGSIGTINVLANDSDENNDVLQITRFSSMSSQGGTISRDGTDIATVTIEVPVSCVGIELSHDSINEGLAVNALVGTFTTTGPTETGSDFRYELVDGYGDNSSFSISNVNRELRLTESADFDVKSSYSIRVRVTRIDDGVWVLCDFTISVLDVP